MRGVRRGRNASGAQTFPGTGDQKGRGGTWAKGVGGEHAERLAVKAGLGRGRRAAPGCRLSGLWWERPSGHAALRGHSPAFCKL